MLCGGGVSNGAAADQAASVTQGVSYVATDARYALSVAVGKIVQEGHGGHGLIEMVSWACVRPRLLTRYHEATGVCGVP